MKTRVYIIALLSVMTIMVHAQAPEIDRSLLHSQLILQTNAHNGTIYEPFTDAVPSEQSAVGASYSSKSKSGPRRSKENPTDPGITDDNSSPIGDAVLPLLAFALVFGGVIYFRRKRAAE